MTAAIVLDTETTSLEEPEVIQLANTVPLYGPEVCAESASVVALCQYFKPRKPIGLGAMATHHILDSDVANAPPWTGSWQVPEGVGYLIGHSVDFDWKAIGSPNLKRICTLALARRYLPDLDAHTLGALTYYFAKDRENARLLLRSAHDASTDVSLCFGLLRELLTLIPGMTSWHQVWLASENARIPLRMGFGKYGPNETYAKMHGGAMKCVDVQHFDPSYFRWLMNNCDQVHDDPYLRKALTGEPAV